MSKSGNILVGDLKEMSEGVVTMKTDYSDSNFKIEWKKIEAVNTTSEYLISVFPDQRYNGALRMIGEDTVAIFQSGTRLKQAPLKDIVYLREIGKNYMKKFSAEMSVGLKISKAENASDYIMGTKLGYQAERWISEAKYDDTRSSRTKSKTIRRMEASLNYKYYLKHNWHTITEVSLYSNSEQNISMRTLGLVGIGRMIVQNDQWNWVVEGGITYNNENFRSEDDNNFKNSSEGFIASEINLFDFEKFELFSKTIAYPSLTDWGRFRLDYALDLKYKLPLSFFVKVGLLFNYDNRPVSDATRTDYVFQTTVGWNFN